MAIIKLSRKALKKRCAPTTLGRSHENTMTFASPMISRSHARLWMEKGNLVVEDHSTNGTCLILNNNQALNVNRRIEISAQYVLSIILAPYGHGAEVISLTD